MHDAPAGAPLLLRGDAYARGELQARLCPDQVPAVRHAVHSRMAGLGDALERPAVADFLAAQWDFARVHDASGFSETLGLAAGFGLGAQTLFAYLHANVIADMTAPPRAQPPAGEGCTAWAARRSDGGGAWVVKNRDYRGEHGTLQRVFHHADPAWGRRTMLCVGSLGSPGAFSSGINSDGLAVADTQIDTRDHGVGWLRYFLMSHLLRSCATLAQALAQITALQHAGGGSLVIGDATGDVAAVELGHGALAAEGAGAPWTVRTNHFTAVPTAAMGMAAAGADAARCSHDRRGRVRDTLQARRGEMDMAAIRALMAGHDQDGRSGPCRHAQGDGSRTLSTVVYGTRIPSLVMSDGAPCLGRWHSYALSGAFG